MFDSQEREQRVPPAAPCNPELRAQTGSLKVLLCHAAARNPLAAPTTTSITWVQRG